MTIAGQCAATLLVGNTRVFSCEVDCLHLSFFQSVITALPPIGPCKVMSHILLVNSWLERVVVIPHSDKSCRDTNLN